MVLSVPIHGAGPTKRHAQSDPQQEHRAWDTPNMVLARHALSHYALIYLDNTGHVRVEESPSLRKLPYSFFTPELRQKFLRSVRAQPRARRLTRPVEPPQHATVNNADVPFTTTDLSLEYATDLPAESASFGGWQPIHLPKRRRTATRDSALEVQYIDDDTDEDDDYATNQIALEIGDEKKVKAYYETALKRLLQTNCRQVGKAFIKFIEPRKQVKYPYNGGKPPPGSAPGAKGDPEKTKPEWWPEGVAHKEPDHLKKDARVRLLLHIIRNLGNRGITADKLREVAYDIRKNLIRDGSEILDEIFRVRSLEERLERQEVDPTTVIYVVNREPGAKNDKDSEGQSDTETLADHDEHENAEQGILTPISSAGQVQSVAMASDSNPVFQMTPTLSFEDQSGPGHPFQSPQSNIKAEYHDSFSQSIAPASTAMTVLSSPAQRGFTYMPHPPFAPSTSEEQIRPTVQPQLPHSQFSGWSPPYQPPIFTPIDYSGGSTRSVQQQVPYPPYSIFSPVHSHETHVAHSLPDLHGVRAQAETQMEAMTLAPPQFRTGSLSHPHVMPRHESLVEHSLP